jgi:hypothetical protein
MLVGVVLLHMAVEHCRALLELAGANSVWQLCSSMHTGLIVLFCLARCVPGLLLSALLRAWHQQPYTLPDGSSSAQRLCSRTDCIFAAQLRVMAAGCTKLDKMSF